MLTFSCHKAAWRKYQGEIRGFLERRASHVGEAEDVLQEVFLKALLQGSSFCELANPRAWLFHVARNLMVDRFRLSKEQVPLPEDLCAEPAPGFDPVDGLTVCLPRILAELSAQDRDAILQCDLQGVAQKEYARQHGLSLSAAKSRVQRARQRMQAQLIKDCQVSFDEKGNVCCFVPRDPLPAEG